MLTTGLAIGMLKVARFGAFDIVELPGASLGPIGSSFTDGEFGYIVSGTQNGCNGKMGRFDLETMKEVTKG